MALTTALNPGFTQRVQLPTTIGRRRFLVSAFPAAVGAITTWYYRTSGGSRDATTDAGSIPAGAVVLRVVTS